jgi:hypothetical protein
VSRVEGRNRFFVAWGLGVYVLILVTSFLHTWESYLPYSGTGETDPLVDPRLEALGVALGLDMAIIYFSFIGVLRRSRTAKSASVTAMLLVWFAVLASMLGLPERLTAFRPGDWPHLAVGFLLSLFVPLSSLKVGQVLGELVSAREPDERPTRLEQLREALSERLFQTVMARLRRRAQPGAVGEAVGGETYLLTEEVAAQAGVAREVLVRDWRAGKLDDVRLKRGAGDRWLWCLEDVLRHYPKEEDGPAATLRDRHEPGPAARVA